MGYNYPMKIKGPNIPFDKFAREDLWALSSLRAFLLLCLLDFRFASIILMKQQPSKIICLFISYWA